MIECSCGGKVDFGLSDVYLISEDNHMRAGVEGLCLNCESNVFVKFIAQKVEIRNYDDDETKFYDIEMISGQIPKNYL